MSDKPIRTDEHQGEIVHVYDGIEEADNRLPRWWLWSLYMTVIFAAVYWLAYEELPFGDSPLEAYNQDKLAALDTGKPVTDEELVALSQDQTMVADGAARFARDCSRCHGARGERKIGPNLTDGFWLGGGSPAAIFETVNRGRERRGMQAWGPTYGRAGVMQVVAYLLTIRDTNVEGKPAEGERWQPPEHEEATAARRGPGSG